MDSHQPINPSLSEKLQNQPPTGTLNGVDVGEDVVVEWSDENRSSSSGPVMAQSPEDTVEFSDEFEEANYAPPRRRRLLLPLVLFAMTCVSTFLAGVTLWNPLTFIGAVWIDGSLDPRRLIIAHWYEGLTYMAAVLAILLAHEMGHFLAALQHRIPASFPFFLPFPVSPLGTLGAVIGMEGSRANRKEIFDIGLAGPIAGLFVAVPMFILGIQRLDFAQDQFGSFQMDLPLAGRWLMEFYQTPGYEPGRMLWQGQLNPLLMAGWVGLFVTGLNMLPVSQLDGGHVIYTLFGKKSHWIARAFMLFAICYMLLYVRLDLILMIALILLIGTDHPPTRDDTVPLGWFRTVLGCVSLAIPLLCFPPRVIIA